MRKLKFRAWHGITNRMIGWRNLLCEYTAFSLFKNPDEYDLQVMQFTGLKDSTGNEIYEGDVIKRYCSCDHCGEQWTGEVVYREDVGQFIFRDYEHEEDTPMPMRDEATDRELVLEVIGNIYENPELVKA